MPDLGIGEGLAAFLPSLFGAGEAAAAPAAEGLGALVGTGEGLFGGATGLTGTALAGGSGLAGDALLGTAGLGALGTAADFLGAGGATGGAGFGAAADAAAGQAATSGLASGTGGIAPTPSIASFTPAGVGGVESFGASGSSNTLAGGAGSGTGGLTPAAGGSSSVFDTGTAGITSANAAGQPSAIPGGASASSVAAPTGVSATPDPTSLGQAAGTLGGGTPAPTSSIDSLVKGATDSLTKNPLGVGLGAAGLGYNILNGQKQTANQKALAGAATTAANTGATAVNAGLPIAQKNAATGDQLTATGQQLQTYMQTGQLPAGYQQQVDQSIQDAKTAAISNAASQGQPTDPTQNTALAATLNRIESQRAQLSQQIAQQLFQSGSADIAAGTGTSGQSAASLLGAGQSSSGLSAELYKTLVQNDTTAAATTGKAIATLAAALNSGGSAKAAGINQAA